MSDLKAVARLLADQAGEAVRFSSERPYPLSDHPLVLVPIKMAGDPAGLFAMGIGNGVDDVVSLVCPEPRNRDAQYDFLLACAEAINPFLATWDDDPFLMPQVITPSSAANKLLLRLVDRITFPDDVPSALKALGRRMHLLDTCFERPDSAMLLDMPTALGHLFATGQDENADQHLGAQIEWLRPSDGNIHARVRTAEGRSVSTSTDPQLDNMHLVPRSMALRRARRQGDHAEVARLGGEITEHLVPEIEHRYDLVREGLVRIRTFPGSERASAIHAADRRRYDSRRVRVADPDKNLSRGLKGAFGHYSFLDREKALHHVETLGIKSVSSARSQARLKGEVLVGEVLDRNEYRAGRSRMIEYEILSHQDQLTFRDGDDLVLLDGAEPFKFEVDGIEIDGEAFVVRLHVTAGKTKAGQPQVGDVIELGPAGPEFRGGNSNTWERLSGLAPRPQVSGPLSHNENLLSLVTSRRSQD